MDNKKILSEYLPENSIDIIYYWIVEHKVHLKITKKRKTKLGDYRPPIRHNNHRISINHDLNKYSFLITLVHEFAHLLVWEKYKNKVGPHGIEWKMQYRELMQNFMGKNIFPTEIEKHLKKSILNSKASTTAEIALSRALTKYDEPTGAQTLEEIEQDAVFILESGKRFKKGPKQRTRYKCLSLDNNKFYLVHALVPVFTNKA